MSRPGSPEFLTCCCLRMRLDIKWSNGDVKLNEASCMKLLEPLQPSNFRFDEADPEISRSAKASDRLGASKKSFATLVTFRWHWTSEWLGSQSTRPVQLRQSTSRL